MNILEGWNTYHFKGDILRHVSDTNQFQNNIRIIGSQDINITIQDIKFQDKSLSNIQNVLFHFDLLRYQLHDIVQKYLYTPDEAMYPTFQMKYVLAIQHVCSWRCYSNNLEDIFFGTPCIGNHTTQKFKWDQGSVQGKGRQRLWMVIANKG